MHQQQGIFKFLTLRSRGSGKFILSSLYIQNKRKFVLSAVSYNQPTFARCTYWNADAITILNSTQLSYSPTRIFVTKNNTLYVVTSADANVIAYREGSVSITRNMSGGFSLFVTGNDDVYVYHNASEQIIRWSINATLSQTVVSVSTSCRGLFIDTKSTLYCSASFVHQIFATSLEDSTEYNTIRGWYRLSWISIRLLELS